MNLKNMQDKLKDDNVHFCVYTLLYNSKVVYVGSTSNLKNRINSHISKNKGLFNEVEYQECPPSEMLSREAGLIVKLNPPLNGNLPTNEKFVSSSTLSKVISDSINEAISSADSSFCSFSDTGGSISYVDADISRDLILSIKSMIKEKLGDSNCHHNTLSGISARHHYDTDCKTGYVGTIHGEDVTGLHDYDHEAKNSAFRFAVKDNKEKMRPVINKHHSMALIMNDSGIYDYK